MRPIEPTTATIKVPHMGWNDVAPTPHARDHACSNRARPISSTPIISTPDDGADVLAMTDHGGGLVAAVGRDNIVGVQFHPEKEPGLRPGAARRAFLEWQPV